MTDLIGDVAYICMSNIPFICQTCVDVLGGCAPVIGKGGRLLYNFCDKTIMSLLGVLRS